MTALPPDRPEPDPRERRPNRRRAVDNGSSERQPGGAKPWSLEPGELHRQLYGRGGFTRAQAMRARKKGR